MRSRADVCEAALRILQYSQSQSFTPSGDPKFSTNTVMQRLEGDGALDDTVRFHLPRALRVIYDIRNKRDAGHLGNGTVNPNLMDATLVVAVMDWVLAEFVRLFHSISVAEAQRLIADIVTREVPIIEEIDGQPVCSRALPVGDLALVYLYRAGQDVGLSIPELQRQMRHGDASNLRRAVKLLDTRKLALHHPVTKQAHITSSGIRYVETKGLLQPAPPHK